MTTLPPYAALLGLVTEPRSDGPAHLVMPFAPDVLGRPGFLHGGAIAGLLEMAGLIAIRHALATVERGRVQPVSATIDYRRGGRDKPTRAVGIVARLGNRIANVEAVAWQDNDRARPIAVARLTYLVARDPELAQTPAAIAPE